MKLPGGIPRVLILVFFVVLLVFFLEVVYLIRYYPLTILGPFLKPSVTAVSDLPGFEVKPTNEPALLEYLEELKFFDKKKVRKVVIHLTDQLQTSRAIGDSQGITMSSDFKTEKMVLHLYVYLRSDVLAKADEARSSFFNTGLLGALGDSVKDDGEPGIK